MGELEQGATAELQLREDGAMSEPTGPPIWTWRHRVAVSCERPNAETFGSVDLLAAAVKRAGSILVPDGIARLIRSDRIEWAGEVTTERMYAAYRRDGMSPDAAALDFGVTCLRVALASIWRWDREQNLPGRVEAQVWQLSVTEGRHAR